MHRVIFLFVAWTILSLSTEAQIANRSLSLDGVSYLKIKDSEQLRFESEVTLAFSAYHSNWPGIQNHTGLVGRLEYGGYSIEIAEHDLRASVMRKGYKWTTYPTRNILPGWHHFAMTYDGQILKLFLDGTQVSNQVFELKMNLIYPEEKLPILLGAELASNGNPQLNTLFDGCIDDVYLFDTALNGDEIKDLSLNKYVGESPKFRMDFNSVTDSISRNEHVSQHGSPQFEKVKQRPQFYSHFGSPVLKWSLAGIVFVLAILLLASKKLILKYRLILFFSFITLFFIELLKTNLIEDLLAPIWNSLDSAFISCLGYAGIILILSFTQTTKKKLYQRLSLILALSSFLVYAVTHPLLLPLWLLQLIIFSAGILVWMLEFRKKGKGVLLFLVTIAVVYISWLGLFAFSSTVGSAPFGFSIPNILLLITMTFVAVQNNHLFIEIFPCHNAKLRLVH